MIVAQRMLKNEIMINISLNLILFMTSKKRKELDENMGLRDTPCGQPPNKKQRKLDNSNDREEFESSEIEIALTTEQIFTILKKFYKKFETIIPDHIFLLIGEFSRRRKIFTSEFSCQ